MTTHFSNIQIRILPNICYLHIIRHHIQICRAQVLGISVSIIVIIITRLHCKMEVTISKVGYTRIHASRSVSLPDVSSSAKDENVLVNMIIR